MTMTWVRFTVVPGGFCTLMALVQTCVMPGKAAGRAFAPSSAAWICSGVVPSFQATVTTWMTDLGAVSAARTVVAPNTSRADASRARRDFFMGTLRFSRLRWAPGEAYQALKG